MNAFTSGVLYLDIFTRKVEQYAGNYLDVVSEISARIEKENGKNAQLAKEIQENKDKANFFAFKGGKMRNVAKKMREKTEELEADLVDVRKEDKTIRHFCHSVPAGNCRECFKISSYSTIKKHKPVTHKANIIIQEK